jgi:hypothetical protein
MEQSRKKCSMRGAELMRHTLSQARRRVHVVPKKLKLDEETRWQIAGEAVGELRRFTPRDRAAGRGLLNSAKDLLFVANPSRQIATNHRSADYPIGSPLVR